MIKKLIMIFLLTFVLSVFVVSTGGCEGLLAGIGIGAASSETLTSWEENLEKKGVELAAKYEEQIQAIDKALTEDQIKKARDAAKETLTAITANDAAKEAAKRARTDGFPTTPLGWLDALIPILAGLYGREKLLRTKVENKRQAEKQGRELTLREIAALPAETVTAPLVKERMYKNIGLSLKG